MRKDHRVALVTGGTKRVGRAIIERLAEEGFAIALTYHTGRQEAQRLARKLGRKTLAIGADLSEPQIASEHIYEEVLNSFGRLDVLVNNASIYLPGSAELKRMMAIHAEAPLLLARLFEPYLRKSSGHIINMVDLLAERPWPEYPAYCASKAALWNLTLSLARDLAPQVTVNGIAPGAVAWPDDYPPAERQRYLKRVPLGRAGAPQDVANLVYFLVTQGTYITGQVIRLDGGRSIT